MLRARTSGRHLVLPNEQGRPIALVDRVTCGTEVFTEIVEGVEMEFPAVWYFGVPFLRAGHQGRFQHRVAHRQQFRSGRVRQQLSPRARHRAHGRFSADQATRALRRVGRVLSDRRRFSRSPALPRRRNGLFRHSELQLDMRAGVGLNHHSNGFLTGVGFAARILAVVGTFSSL